MIELHIDRAEEVHKELAMTGKYFNTGKVLMGVAYVPRARPMSHDEERIQRALLKGHGPRIAAGTWHYVAYVAIVVAAVLMASVL
jgi:hypothetical protein